MIGWLAAINHAATATCVAAEHAMLAVLDGSCRTPIAGHAILDDRRRTLSARPDRQARRLGADRHGAARRRADAEAMGREAGDELKRRGGPGFLST